MSPFSYMPVSDIATAVASAARHTSNGSRDPAVDFVAGGTDMMQLMAGHLRMPGHVVDVTGLSSLDRINISGDGVRLGATVRMADAARHPDLLRRYTVLPQALLASASASIRNLATLGGNVLQRTRCGYFRDAGAPCNKRDPGTGCPAIAGRNRDHAVFGGSEHCIAPYMSDYANALAVLDATVRIAGPSGERSIPFLSLHHPPGDTPWIETQLAPGELITAYDLPAAESGWRSHYLKVRDRRSYQWATASAAVLLDIGEDQEVRDARIAIGGVATTPLRRSVVEAQLRGRRLSAALCHEAAAASAEGAVTHGDNAHKPELLRRTVARALEMAGGLT